MLYNNCLGQKSVRGKHMMQGSVFHNCMHEIVFIVLLTNSCE